MKKIISMLLVLSAVLSLSACGISVNIDTAKDADAGKPQNSETVGDKIEDTVLTAVGISPEFKEMMDSYEAFFDEYCEFMKKYSAADDPMSMFAEYSEFMMKYAEYMTKLDDVGKKEMTDEELLYYTEINLRIQENLLEVSQMLEAAQKG